MRKLIALSCVLAIVGIASVASAATKYWVHRGDNYVCRGEADVLICDDDRSPYAVAISPTFLAILGANDKPLYFCKRNYRNVCAGGS